MDFTEHGAERNIVDARDLPNGTQNRDEPKRLQDDIRAIEPLEHQMILRASARPAPISNPQFSPPASPSKQKRLVIFTVAVGIVAGAAIGVVFGAMNMVQLAPKVPEVTHSLAEQIPATRSAQIPTAAETGGAPLDQVPAPAQTTSSNVAPALSTALAQPAAATAEYDKAAQSGEGENASLPIDGNVAVVTNAQRNASSPLAEAQEDESVLFREFLEWRSNQVKPPAQQQRPLHASKHVRRPHVLGSHPTNVPDAAIVRTHSSSRTNGRHGPPGSKDSERRS